MQTHVITSDRGDVLAALEQGVDAILTSDGFRAYLTAQARFRQYSVNNVLLILHQQPDATRVAGYRTWESMGRQVRKGEKGIRIMAPRIGKEDRGDGVVERRVTGFGVATVFDVSQTDGDALPEDPTYCASLTGDSEEARAITGRCESWLREQGITVDYEDVLDRDALGTWNPQYKRVTLLGGMAADQTAKTIVHEAAHAVSGHGTAADDGHEGRDDREVVAEAAAYVTCATLGLDTSSYAFGYIAGWAGKSERFRKNLGQARDVATALIEALTAGTDVPAPVGTHGG